MLCDLCRLTLNNNKILQIYTIHRQTKPRNNYCILFDGRLLGSAVSVGVWAAYLRAGKDVAVDVGVERRERDLGFGLCLCHRRVYLLLDLNVDFLNEQQSARLHVESNVSNVCYVNRKQFS